MLRQADDGAGQTGDCMSHLVRNTDRLSIDFDSVTGQVTVLYRWRYVWVEAAGVSPWTMAQRRRFHARAERAVRAAWDGRASLRVGGASDLARRFAGRALPLRIDIAWVRSGQHWTVTVTKIPPGQFKQSYVVWDRRTISLDSEDLTLREFGIGAEQTHQMPVAHEFGHVFGNVPQRGHGDEYRDESPFNADHRSILNVGDQLRVRHFDHILSELNAMAPGMTFVVANLR